METSTRMLYLKQTFVCVLVACFSGDGKGVYIVNKHAKLSMSP